MEKGVSAMNRLYYVIDNDDLVEIQRKTLLEAKDKDGRIQPIFHCEPVELGELLPYCLETSQVCLPGDFNLYKQADFAIPGKTVLGKVLRLS